MLLLFVFEFNDNNILYPTLKRYISIQEKGAFYHQTLESLLANIEISISFSSPGFLWKRPKNEPHLLIIAIQNDNLDAFKLLYSRFSKKNNTDDDDDIIDLDNPFGVASPSNLQNDDDTH